MLQPVQYESLNPLEVPYALIALTLTAGQSKVIYTVLHYSLSACTEYSQNMMCSMTESEGHLSNVHAFPSWNMQMMRIFSTNLLSMRLSSSLANGGSADAGLDISLKKTKAMPIRRCNPVSETAEEEIVALNLKHKCSACSRTFPTERGLKIHRARWCRPEGPERSRKGSLADKAVKHAKRVKQTSEQPQVSINGIC